MVLLFSQDKLLVMRKSLSFMSTVNNEELGLDDDDILCEVENTLEPSIPVPRPSKVRLPKPKPRYVPAAVMVHEHSVDLYFVLLG